MLLIDVSCYVFHVKKLILASLFISFSSYALTYKEFFKLAKTESPEVQSVRLRYEVSDLQKKRLESTFDWVATVEIGKDRDRRLSLANRANDLEESDLFSTNVTKYFQTGTLVTAEVLSEKLESTTTFLAGPRDGQFNSYLFTIEQNLWRDSFGIGSRATLESAKAQGSVTQMEGFELVEEVLLKGSDLYWKATVAYRRLIESESALKRYKGLVKNIENKSKNKYAAPGEYSQVKAEYFNRQRLAHINKLEFDEALLELKIFLPSMSSDQWVLPEETPQYAAEVKATQKNLEQTRIFKISNLRNEIAKNAAISAKQENRSQVALVGEVGATGVDVSSSTAQEQLLDGSRPHWYMGIKWSHSFGSDVQSASSRQAAALAKSQEILTLSEIERIKKKKVQLELAILSLEDNLKIQSQLLDSRRDAVKELTRAYNQGRIDISVLIEAINRAELAEVEQVQVRADLELTYIEWQALLDILEF